MWDKEWVWAKSFCEDRLRAAAERRLAAQAAAANPQPAFGRRLLYRIGKRLITWGTALERQYAEKQPIHLEYGKIE